MKVKIRDRYIDFNTISVIEVGLDLTSTLPDFSAEKLILKNIFGTEDIEVCQIGLEDTTGFDSVVVSEDSLENLERLYYSNDYYCVGKVEEGVRKIYFYKKEDVKNRWEKEKQFIIDCWKSAGKKRNS